MPAARRPARPRRGAGTGGRCRRTATRSTRTPGCRGGPREPAERRRVDTKEGARCLYASASPPTVQSPRESSRTSRRARSLRSRRRCTPAGRRTQCGARKQQPMSPPPYTTPTCPSCSVESDSCTVAPVWASVRRAAKSTWGCGGGERHSSHAPHYHPVMHDAHTWLYTGVRGSVNRSVPERVREAPGARVPAGMTHSSGVPIRRSPAPPHPGSAPATTLLPPASSATPPSSPSPSHSWLVSMRRGCAGGSVSPTGSASSPEPGGAVLAQQQGRKGGFQQRLLQPASSGPTCRPQCMRSRSRCTSCVSPLHRLHRRSIQDRPPHDRPA